MRLINRDELNEQLAETLDRMKSKGVEPTWDDAMYVIDMIDDAPEGKMKDDRLIELLGFTKSIATALSDQIINLSRELEERWEDDTIDYAMQKAFFRMDDAVSYLEDVEDIILDKHLKSAEAEEE